MGLHWIQVWVEGTLWSPETSVLEPGSPFRSCLGPESWAAGLTQVLTLALCCSQKWEVRVSLGLCRRDSISGQATWRPGIKWAHMCACMSLAQ